MPPVLAGAGAVRAARGRSAVGRTARRRQPAGTRRHRPFGLAGRMVAAARTASLRAGSALQPPEPGAAASARRPGALAGAFAAGRGRLPADAAAARGGVARPDARAHVGARAAHRRAAHAGAPSGPGRRAGPGQPAAALGIPRGVWRCRGHGAGRGRPGASHPCRHAPARGRLGQRRPVRARAGRSGADARDTGRMQRPAHARPAGADRRLERAARGAAARHHGAGAARQPGLCHPGSGRAGPSRARCPPGMPAAESRLVAGGQSPARGARAWRCTRPAARWLACAP